jgi:hypothetical protein
MLTHTQTRSGKTFSPHLAPPTIVSPIHSPLAFDIAPLLQAATLAESDGMLDEDEHTEAVDTLDDPPSPRKNKRHRDASPSPPMESTGPPLASTAEPSKTPHRHKKRRARRAAKKATEPSPRTLEMFVQPAVAIETGLNSEQLPAAKGAYSARNQQHTGAKKARGLEEMVAELSFRLVEWDGV